jgi:hypothetical protein
MLDDDAVSRRHVRTEPRGGFSSWMWARATAALSERVAGEAKLENGDRIKIGSTDFST